MTSNPKLTDPDDQAERTWQMVRAFACGAYLAAIVSLMFLAYTLFQAPV